MVAYPAAQQGEWNTGTDDDVAFLRALIANIKAQHNVDAARVYIVGFSNGAQMAWRMACRAPELLAGAALVAGSYPAYSDCKPNTLPLLVFHGTHDNVMPVEGSEVQDSPQQMLAREATQRHCTGPSVASSNLEFTKLTWSGCTNPPQLYLLRGKGHSWPGSSMAPEITSASVDAITIIVDEFLEHRP